MASDDEQLVTEVLAGVPGAFTRLVSAHQQRVWHIAFQMTNQSEDAQDLCQEIFMRVYATLAQFRSESSLGTWISKVAFSVAANAIQRKRIPLASSDNEVLLMNVASDARPENLAQQSQLGQALERAIAGLSPLERALITLFHAEELPVAEIATIVDIPVGTVKNYLFRARRKLRGALAAFQGDTP